MPNNQLPLPGMPSNLPRLEIPMTTCPCCSAEVGEEDAVSCNDELHCPACVHLCENCDFATTDGDELYTAYLSGRGRRSDASAQLCRDCSFECVNCDNYFSNRITTYNNPNADRICARCAEQYGTCEGCDTLIHADASYFHEPTDQTLCQSCYQSARDEEEEEDSSHHNEDGETVIHGHWHKPRPVFFSVPGEQCVNGKAIPYFGCEFEVEQGRGYDADNVTAAQTVGLFPNPFYHCEEDGSLRSGFEVVSKAATWKYWQTVDLAWMHKLRRLGYRSFNTTTCGQHIHVSRAFLSEAETFCLLAFVKHNTEFMRRLSRRVGGENSYAKFAPIQLSSTVAAVRKCRPGGEKDRYEAINLENANTIEFRMFRGTLCPIAFRRNLSLVTALVHFAKWANGGRQQWLDAEFFTKWVRTKGRKVLGDAGAKILADWTTHAIESIVSVVSGV